MLQINFSKVRPLFNGRLTQSQVDGLNTLMTAINAARVTDPRWVAYMLATAFHETAQTMQPIKEAGGQAYFRRRYDITGERPALAKANGNIYPGDGAKFCGRGYVQLTWRSNYERMSKIIDTDLVADPDKAMRPDIAADVMIIGMKQGRFTGRHLSEFFNERLTDWVGARRIINGTDRAELIAGYAKVFLSALHT